LLHAYFRIDCREESAYAKASVDETGTKQTNSFLSCMLLNDHHRRKVDRFAMTATRSFYRGERRRGEKR
ncbi:MAG: hypothetical protein ACXWV3_08260, partial [Flavisolibacter sp.]